MFATKLSDLDDFITPSQECVKMIVPSTTDKQAVTSKVTIDKDMDEDWRIEADPGHDIKPDLIKTSKESSVASVSLSDCLACSGCVTSAETVLIQMHSIEEFLKLFSPDNIVVVAISP